MTQPRTSLWRSLGPGLLYAGAAVGVSHLVQSTRAGAEFGFQLLGVVVLANVLKYPFFEIGPRYAVITGKNLIEGYASLGKWAVVLFFLMTLGTMFAVIAAVSLVTAGLASELFGISGAPWQWATMLLAICAIVLMVGHYRTLDRFIKWVILVLTAATIVVVTAAFLTTSEATTTTAVTFDLREQKHLFFLIALVGWMPAPIDISVWHSMWTQAKARTQGQVALKDALRDFHIGYWGTTFLAICFLTLGALVIYGTGISMPAQAGAYAREFIGIYTGILGDWSFLFVATAAFATMLSTTLTVLDGYSRVMVPLCDALLPRSFRPEPLYNTWIILSLLGAIAILLYLVDNMLAMLDFATTLSFLLAPLFGFLNVRLILSPAIPAHLRPSRLSRGIAWTGRFFLTGFSIYYGYLLWT